MNGESRVREAAFRITAQFEGDGYHAYRSHDRDIIRYGRFQFSLASGTLGRIVEAYLSQAATPTALALRAYQSQLAERDPALHDDPQIRDWLVAAASEPVMQRAQDDEAAVSLWEATRRVALAPRGLQTPLAHALLFDLSVSFGVGDGFLRMAERECGVPERSRIGENGLTEAQLITRVAELSQSSYDRQAALENRPGQRGSFWLNLVRKGDWQLESDFDRLLAGMGPTIPTHVPDTRISSDEEAGDSLYIMADDDRIRIRTQPVDGETIAVMSRGAVLEVLEPHAQAAAKVGVEDQWLHVRAPVGIEGYTAARFYRLHQAHESPLEPKPLAAPLPPPQPVAMPIPNLLLVTPTGDQVRIHADAANNEVIGSAGRGDVLQVLEPRAEALKKIGIHGQWLHLQLPDGAEGFGPAWQFMLHHALPTAVENEAAPMPAAARADPLYITPTDDHIRIRTQAINGDVVRLVSRGDVLEVLDPPDEARSKIGVGDQWLQVIGPDQTEGYIAAWFFRRFEGYLPQKTIQANMTGVDLDLFHPHGTPDPARLGKVGWVRMVYNLSLDPDKPEDDPLRYGNKDLDATYQRSLPVLQRYAAAGIKVLLVLNEKTFGEGADYRWDQMNTAAWRDLAFRFAHLAGRVAAQFHDLRIVCAYQIWDEMDAPSGARETIPMPPEMYAYLLAQSIRAIRASDSDALVITGGHSGDLDEALQYARLTLNAMPDDIRPDGLALHPYGRGDSQSELRFASRGLIDDAVNGFAALMPGWPVWITGWGVLNAAGESPDGVAHYAREFIDRLRKLYAHKVAAAIWSPWAQSMNEGYGLVDDHDAPRGSFTEEFLNL